MTILRVLHVDDEPDIREVVEMSLGLDPDFETRSCGNAHEALAIATDWTPDIIILDVMMPEIDGPATLGCLRDNPRTASIPIVFMTARAQSRELDHFRSLGALGVIPKPFDPMTLASSVRGYLEPIDGFHALRNEFLHRANDDASMLVVHRFALKDKTAVPVTLAKIRDIAHGLAGSGGIFGFPDISDAAAALEESIVVELNGSGAIEGILRSLDRLLACVEANRRYPEEPSQSRLDS